MGFGRGGGVSSKTPGRPPVRYVQFSLCWPLCPHSANRAVLSSNLLEYWRSNVRLIVPNPKPFHTVAKIVGVGLLLLFDVVLCCRHPLLSIVAVLHCFFSLLSSVTVFNMARSLLPLLLLLERLDGIPILCWGTPSHPTSCHSD